jgi:HK97 family phage prohead protease
MRVLKFLAPDEFRDRLRKRENVSAYGVRSDVISTPRSIGDAKDRTIRFCFSDSSIDRMGDTIAVAGWELANFRANPTALWAHDSSQPPIGRAENVGVVGDRLMGNVTFAPAETNAFADSIYKMILGKFIRACSVGFRPLEFSFSKDPKRPYGIDFKRQELLEISICAVPANASALTTGKSARSVATMSREQRATKTPSTPATPLLSLEARKARAAILLAGVRAALARETDPAQAAFEARYCRT